jgi:hypothetical protein
MGISDESGLSYQHAANVGFFVANLYIAKNFKPVSKLSRCWGVGSAKNAIRAANCVAGLVKRRQCLSVDCQVGLRTHHTLAWCSCLCCVVTRRPCCSKTKT